MRFEIVAAFVIGVLLPVMETGRRGISTWTSNFTTMFEDYFCGALLFAAAISWTKKRKDAQLWMAVAWAYATGGMFVPFFAHLEAWMRGVTFRPDHPHADVQSIILKGVIWAICLVCLVVTVRKPPPLNTAFAVR